MKNPPVRFSLDDDGTIFCYKSSKNLPADGIYATENGVCYDMAVLAQLLAKGEQIDEAIVGRVPATGECHWVFEGQVVSEVNAPRDPGVDESVRLRLEELSQKNQVLTNDREAILADHARLVTKVEELNKEVAGLRHEKSALAREREVSALNEARRMASAGEPLISGFSNAKPSDDSKPLTFVESPADGSDGDLERLSGTVDIAGAMAPQDATPKAEGDAPAS